MRRLRPARVVATWVVCWALAIGGGGSADEVPLAWVDRIVAPQYFALLVEDVDTCVAWYRSAFGLRELGGSAAEDGSWRIANLGSEQLRVEIIRDARAEGVGRALGFRKVGFEVADVEAVADRVEEATGERPRVVRFEPLRQRILQLEDPEGNVIQLTSPLE